MTDRVDHTGTLWVCHWRGHVWELEVGPWLDIHGAYRWKSFGDEDDGCPFTHISQKALDTGVGYNGARFLPYNNIEKLEELFT